MTFEIRLLFIICLFGCSPHGELPPVVRVVVPTGYEGKFEIILDRQNGVDISQNDGEYRYVIPTDGVLRVQSDEPFYKRHRPRFQFADGADCGDRVVSGYPILPTKKIDEKVPRYITTHDDGTRNIFYVHYSEKYRRDELGQVDRQMAKDDAIYGDYKAAFLELLDSALREDVDAMTDKLCESGVVIGEKKRSLEEIRAELMHVFKHVDYRRFSIHDAVSLEAWKISANGGSVEIIVTSKISYSQEGADYFQSPIVCVFGCSQGGEISVSRLNMLPLLFYGSRR